MGAFSGFSNPLIHVIANSSGGEGSARVLHTFFDLLAKRLFGCIQLNAHICLGYSVSMTVAASSFDFSEVLIVIEKINLRHWCTFACIGYHLTVLPFCCQEIDQS